MYEFLQVFENSLYTIPYSFSLFPTVINLFLLLSNVYATESEQLPVEPAFNYYCINKRFKSIFPIHGATIVMSNAFSKIEFVKLYSLWTYHILRSNVTYLLVLYIYSSLNLLYNNILYFFLFFYFLNK